METAPREQEKNIIKDAQFEMNFSEGDLEKRECEELAKKHHLPKERIIKVNGEFYHVDEKRENPEPFEKWMEDMKNLDENLRWDQK
jgi:hypothetical protein